MHRSIHVVSTDENEHGTGGLHIGNRPTSARPVSARPSSAARPTPRTSRSRSPISASRPASRPASARRAPSRRSQALARGPARTGATTAPRSADPYARRLETQVACSQAAIAEESNRLAAERRHQTRQRKQQRRQQRRQSSTADMLEAAFQGASRGVSPAGSETDEAQPRQAHRPRNPFEEKVVEASRAHHSNLQQVQALSDELQDSRAREERLRARLSRLGEPNDEEEEKDEEEKDAEEDESEEESEEEGVDAPAADSPGYVSRGSGPARKRSRARAGRDVAAVKPSAAARKGPIPSADKGHEEEEEEEASVSEDNESGKSGSDESDAESDTDPDLAWIQRTRSEFLGPETAPSASSQPRRHAASPRAAVRPQTAPGNRGHRHHRRDTSPASSARGRPESAPRKQNRSSFGGFRSGTETKKKKTIAQQRFEEEKRRQEEELEKILSYKFKAKEVPASTKGHLFERILRQQATRRKLVHEARRAELEAMTQPFQRLMEHEEEMQNRIRQKQADQIREEERALEESRRFRANPVPPTTHDADAATQAREQRESERQERVQQRAQQLLRQSSLPPRMAVRWQQQQEQEHQQQVQLQETMAREREMFRPKINPDLPDFATLQANFLQSMQKHRQAKAPTTPQPFSFDTRERQERERAHKEARERAKEALQASDTFGATGRSSRGRRRHSTGGRELAGDHDSSPMRSRRLSVSAATGGGFAATAGQAQPSLVAKEGFRASMTRSVELRLQRMEAERAAERKRELLRVKEDEARKAKRREVAQSLRPLLDALEHERIGDEPRSWEIADTTESAQLKRKQAQEEFAERWRENQERIADAEARRPPLFMRASLDAARSAARRSAVLRVAAHLHGAETMKGGDDGNDDEPSWRALLSKGGASAAVSASGVWSHQDRDILETAEDEEIRDAWGSWRASAGAAESKEAEK